MKEKVITNLKIPDESSVNEVFSCYQCQKCSSGCPIANEMDILPAEIIRLLRLGFMERVLSSRTIWICASCETCTTRCPNEIDIAAVMDQMRHESIKKGYTPVDEDVLHFHRSFLSSIKTFGRVHELEMIGLYKMKSGRYFDDLLLGFNMFRKGKLKLLPHRIRGMKDIKRIFSNYNARTRS